MFVAEAVYGEEGLGKWRKLTLSLLDTPTTACEMEVCQGVVCLLGIEKRLLRGGKMDCRSTCDPTNDEWFVVIGFSLRRSQKSGGTQKRRSGRHWNEFYLVCRLEMGTYEKEYGFFFYFKIGNI